MTFEKNFTTVICKFLKWQPAPSDERYQSNCSIVYGYNSRFPTGSESALGLSLSGMVVLNLSISEVQFKQEYRFIVTASNGTFTVQVRGMFGKSHGCLKLLSLTCPSQKKNVRVSGIALCSQFQNVDLFL